MILNKRQILALGHDASKIPADYLTHRLNFLKLRARTAMLGDEDAVKMTLASLTNEDAVIFFSFPPYHYPSRSVAEYARHRGAEIIAFTDSMDSPVVSDDSYNLLCEIKAPFLFNGLSVPLAFVDILICCIAIELGEKMQAIINEMHSVSEYFSLRKDSAEGGANA